MNNELGIPPTNSNAGTRYFWLSAFKKTAFRLLPASFKDYLEKSSKIRGVKWLAAAVARCEEVFEYYKAAHEKSENEAQPSNLQGRLKQSQLSDRNSEPEDLSENLQSDEGSEHRGALDHELEGAMALTRISYKQKETYLRNRILSIVQDEQQLAHLLEKADGDLVLALFLAQDEAKKSRETTLRLHLLQLVDEETLLKPFRVKAAGNPELALALAKAEVRKVDVLRSYGWQPPWGVVSRFSKVLLVPAVLIALTAVLGNYVGSSLQEEAFHRNKSFEHKLALLQESKSKASDWYVKASRIYYDIDDNERDRQQEFEKLQRSTRFSTSSQIERQQLIDAFDYEARRGRVKEIEDLQKLLDELDRMKGDNDLVDNQSTISNAEKIARAEIRGSLSCLQNDQINWKNPCSQNFILANLEGYRDSVVKVTAPLLSEK